MKLQFQIFVLAKRKFTQPILDLYGIYYSKVLRHFVTFNPAVRDLRRAVVREIRFGDLCFDPVLVRKLKKGKSNGTH